MANINEVMKERRKHSFGSFLLCNLSPFIIQHFYTKVFNVFRLLRECMERLLLSSVSEQAVFYSSEFTRRRVSLSSNSKNSKIHSHSQSLESETLLPLRVSGVFYILCYSKSTESKKRTLWVIKNLLTSQRIRKKDRGNEFLNIL